MSTQASSRKKQPVETMVVDANGTQKWYKRGKLHRENGPAIIKPNGVEFFWYQNGKLHRDDGPAVSRFGSEQQWYQHGHLHREDGPALIWADGEVSWFLDGTQFTFEEFCDKTPLSDAEKMLLVLRYTS